MSFQYSSKLVLTTIVVTMLWVSFLFSHCEIPCGIYNDKMRIDMIKEHITTIEKSMNQTPDITKATPRKDRISR